MKILIWMWFFSHTATTSTNTSWFFCVPIARFSLERTLERKCNATGHDCVGQTHNWKTNRKSLSQAWLPLKTLFETLNQLFQNKCGKWLQWNFCYWDVVERGPRSELSSYCARQTAAWLRGGGHEGHEGHTPFFHTLPVTPPHSATSPPTSSTQPTPLLCSL